MPTLNHTRRPLALALIISAAAAPLPLAHSRPTPPQQQRQQQQQQQQPAREQTPPGKADATQEEVIRVDTELVQAAVTVLDAKGQFVDGLRPEQFELRVDGKPTAVSFSERVSAGTAKELGLLAAASGSKRGPAATAGGDADASVVGRAVYFFVDDMHLSTTGVGRARRMILDYVNGLMGDEDWAAVASTSGQIGFLQQLTDERAVLRKAIGRVGYAQPLVTDNQRPKIGVEQAFAVQEREDQNMLEHLINETLRDGPPGMTRAIAEAIVRSRVRDVMRASAELNRNTLKTLHSLLRTSAQRPGRKIVFFISEGFLLQTQNADDRDLLQGVTDAAARADAVVFSVDAKGLAADPDFEAANTDAFDARGLLASASPGALGLFLSQEPIRQLAAETGGRAIINTNAPGAGIARALEETARYYLVAWRPEGDAARGGRFRRLEVRVAGRPDLTVRVHKGFLTPRAPASPPAGKQTVAGSDPSPANGATGGRAPQDELRAAVAAAYPRAELPTTLAAAYAGDAAANGVTLAVSVGVGSESLTFKAADGGRTAAAVEFACVVLSDEGKPTETMYKRLEAATRAGAGEAGVPRRTVMQEFQFNLRPGLYQVRAAARDMVSGRTGGAVGWIEIPDLSKGKLALAGLTLGEMTAATRAGVTNVSATLSTARPLAGRPLARGARLHFSAFVHDAARGANGALPPTVSVRAEVLGSGRVVSDTGARDLPTDGLEDFARLPYAAEINLEGLSAGRYLLRVTATDQTAAVSVTQQIKFEIR